VAAGDSAGANLLLSTTLKCLHLGIPPPMGLFVAYVPTLVNFVPSPARLLCMMDPLLPFGFMMRCLKGKNFEITILPCQNNVVRVQLTLVPMHRKKLKTARPLASRLQTRKASKKYPNRI
jgi:hypothetical protein